MKPAACAVLLAALMAGCSNIPDLKPWSFTKQDEQPPTVEDINRNQGLALLYDLLNSESQVAQIFTIKSASDPVKAVVNDIQAAAKDGAAMLKARAKADAFVNLTDTGLPNVEVQTRKRIAWATTGQLLLASGEQFELDLLLTQTKATNYAASLAATLAAAEDDKQHAQKLKDLGDRFSKLQQRVDALLAVRAAEVNDGEKDSQ